MVRKIQLTNRLVPKTSLCSSRELLVAPASAKAARSFLLCLAANKILQTLLALLVTFVIAQSKFVLSFSVQHLPRVGRAFLFALPHRQQVVVWPGKDILKYEFESFLTDAI